MSNPTAEQKARKKRLENLIHHLNRIRVDISLHRISNWSQIIHQLGIEKEPEYAGFLYQETQPTVGSFNEQLAFPLENKLRKTLADEASGLYKPAPPEKIEEPVYDSSVHGPHPLDSLDWIPPYNPKQVCSLFPHQTKAVKDLVYLLHVKNLRAAALLSGVGTGKTFMFGQYARWLHDKNWFKQVYCLSPWPILIVTKASIVEQTRRVMVNQFGLDPHRQVMVINYDSLRATFGASTMIDIDYKVDGGVRFKTFKWRPFIHPMIFIFDEGQSAKNEDSQQSEIVQAVAAIDNPNVKVIVSSATPWTRVSEAKYFAIQTQMEYKLI